MKVDEPKSLEFRRKNIPETWCINIYGWVGGELEMIT